MAPGLFGAAAALAVAVSLAVHVALNCPIDPAPSPPFPAGPRHTPNNLLQASHRFYAVLSVSAVFFYHAC